MAKFHCGGLTGTCVALLMLTACAREGRDEMSWARAALERNSALEVVAADQQSRTFTVRVKRTGELSMLRADQVIGAPPPVSSGAAPASGTSVGSEANAAGPAAAAPAPPPAPTQITAEAAPASPPAPQPPPASEGQPQTQQASLAPQSTPGSEAGAGRVLESGPGYTIKAATAVPAPVGTRDAGITSAPIERRHEPIVCQGSRLVHIDNRNLVFDGDAVSAEDGCEIHITNSRIRATGVGVSARAAAVHIDNSLIEGDQAAIDASEGAQVYAAFSRFKGLSRRLDNAAFHDLGGNVWN
ncbi:MAG TPA: hypothetical protein VED45_08495 [Steroidobacteraceae bacterium]|nr:hypothetical protein [Steroidobacteraceae bacterium]